MRYNEHTSPVDIDELTSQRYREKWERITRTFHRELPKNPAGP